MGNSNTPSDGGSTGRRGRRSRVAGGFPFQCRVALTKRDGAQLTERAAREDLTVSAYASQLLEQHLAGSGEPLPPSARDLLEALNAISNELRVLLKEARAEGVLLNQIARHLNAHHPTQHGVPDTLAGVLSRTLVRHQATTTAIDNLLTRTDHLLTTSTAVLPRRRKAMGRVR